MWSDRGAAQAAGSLRQCLVQLRKVLPDPDGLLETNRRTVRLDLERVNIVMDPGQDLLEGMDLRDEAFEEWLRDSRMRTQPHAVVTSLTPARVAPQRQRKSVVVRATAHVDDLRWLVKLLADDFMVMASESFSIDVWTDQATEPPRTTWVAEIDASHTGPAQVGVRMALKDRLTGAQIWAGNRVVETKGAPPSDHPELVRLSNQLTEAVGDALLRLQGGPLSSCPDSLCRQAIRRMFEITPESVAVADALFAEAFALEERGLYLAWRAQTQTIMRIERHDIDQLALGEEADALCARALELEPNNSMVLATVANTYGQVFRSFEMAGLLAQRSVRLNPANPMAWFALSSSSMYAGRSRESLRYAVKANMLAETSPHRFWWDSQIFAASMVLGLLPEALHFGRLCHVQNPKFRPPMRYLLALYANAGQDEAALEMAGKLSELEDDFSIDRLVNDREYPASVLHRDIGVDLRKVASLA